MIKRVIVSTLLVGCVALAAAQGDSAAAAAAANKSKGADALDAMLSTSKPAAPSAKNGTAPAAAASAAPAPAPSSTSSSPAPAAAAAPAKASSTTTGGSSAAGCSTPLQWLQNSGNYKKFLQLIDATPSSARLADILDSPDVALTLLAPTDDAIADSLSKQGLSFSDLVANPALSLMVLQFHMLPNPIPTDQFVNGYSFNTLLPGDNFQDSVSVAKGGGDKIKLKGPHNAATLLDNGAPACISTVYSTDALLLPKRAIAGGASSPAAPAAPAAAKAGAAGADMPAGGDVPAAADATAPAAATPRRAGPAAAAAAAEPAAPAAAASRPPPEGARRAAAKGETGGAPADPNAPVLVDAPAASG